MVITQSWRLTIPLDNNEKVGETHCEERPDYVFHYPEKN